MVALAALSERFSVIAGDDDNRPMQQAPLLEDLEKLVEQYNATYAGRRTPTGPIAPPVTLPDDYAFDDNFFTQDVRLSRSFRLGRYGARLSLFGEVFNLLNTHNLVGYSGNLAGATFGQPTGRFTQVFGSGGPRAFQFGARVSF